METQHLKKFIMIYGPAFLAVIYFLNREWYLAGMLVPIICSSVFFGWIHFESKRQKHIR